MKKLLTILGAVGLTATAGATVVACGTDPAEKGDFELSLKDAKLTVAGTSTLTIKDFDKDKIAEKWTDFKVVFETEKGEEFATITAPNEKGEATVTAVKKGTVKFYYTAEKVTKDEGKEEDKVSLQDETKPAEPAGRSQTITLTIEEMKVGEIFKDKLDLKEMTEADAKEAVKKMVEDAGLTDYVNTGEAEVKDGKGTIKVTAKEDKADYATGEVTFTFTLPATK